jgi:hypothetical protein
MYYAEPTYIKTAAEYYTTTYAAPGYYKEDPKYYTTSAPSYYVETSKY